MSWKVKEKSDSSLSSLNYLPKGQMQTAMSAGPTSVNATVDRKYLGEKCYFVAEVHHVVRPVMVMSGSNRYRLLLLVIIPLTIRCHTIHPAFTLY